MAAIGGGHARIMDEFQLIEKLRLVENLFAGAATEGEREAAASAMDRGAKGVRGERGQSLHTCRE